MNRTELKELRLPDFAFMDDGEVLRGRNVIIHLRTHTIVEMVEVGYVLLKPETIQIPFAYLDEEMICCLHISLLEDPDEIEFIMHRAIEFYINDCMKLDSLEDIQYN